MMGAYVCINTNPSSLISMCAKLDLFQYPKKLNMAVYFMLIYMNSWTGVTNHCLSVACSNWKKKKLEISMNQWRCYKLMWDCVGRNWHSEYFENLDIQIFSILFIWVYLPYGRKEKAIFVDIKTWVANKKSCTVTVWPYIYIFIFVFQS